MSKTTIRKAITSILDDLLPVATATELAFLMNRKLSSVSSILKKMHRAGEVCRRKGLGPRGGNGYWRKNSGW